MRRRTTGLIVVGVAGLIALGAGNGSAGQAGDPEIVVIAHNDLGMHCMNDDFTDFLILPPFNTLRAQVIQRKGSPEILEDPEKVRVHFDIPSNTSSADKTNFWTHAEALFGVKLDPDVGLTGTGLSGDMERVSLPGKKYWEAVGIPLTPYDDSGRENPYPLAHVLATHTELGEATTVAVVPVSAELRCNLCHEAEGHTANYDVLMDHDRLHGTTLVDQRPVLCASCHADPVLGLPGDPELPAFSTAIHSAHADRMDLADVENECYACHPGVRTQCQRDLHLAMAVDCTKCHGGMAAVGSPDRTPWTDLPRCANCHQREGFEFEQPGTLFKDSVGHGGVMCATCHGSPHTTLPAITPTDNQQNILKQGYPGTLDDCLVCHTSQPEDAFFHRRDDD